MVKGNFAKPGWYFGRSLPRVHVVVGKTPLSAGKHLIYHPIKRHLARAWVRFLQKRGLIVIGITGTAGKTTLKEMLLSVLSEKYPVLASRENIDPVFNIPSTILRCGIKHKILILEMGIEYPGEMDFYNYLVTPNIAVITSLDRAHAQFLGTVDDIAREKLKLFSDKVALKLANGVDPGIKKYVGDTECILIGTQVMPLKKTEVSITGTTIKYEFESLENELNINLVGEHFAPLVLIAVYIANHLGLSTSQIKQGLNKLTPVKHRFEIISNHSGLIIIDDTYNANPLAMRAALKTAEQLKNNRKLIVVLGEMKELGKISNDEHTAIGGWARDCGVNYLIAYTKEAGNYLTGFNKSDSSFIADNQSMAVKKVKDIIKDNYDDYLVLVKGSHSLKMDELVVDLEKI